MIDKSILFFLFIGGSIFLLLEGDEYVFLREILLMRYIVGSC